MNLVKVTLTFEVDIERGIEGVPPELSDHSWFQTIVKGLGPEGMARTRIVSVFQGRRKLTWLGDLPSPSVPCQSVGEEK